MSEANLCLWSALPPSLLHQQQKIGLFNKPSPAGRSAATHTAI